MKSNRQARENLISITARTVKPHHWSNPTRSHASVIYRITRELLKHEEYVTLATVHEIAKAVTMAPVRKDILLNALLGHEFVIDCKTMTIYRGSL